MNLSFTNPSSQPDEDVVLMDQIRTGHPEALECLVHRHQQSLVNFFRRMGAYSDAEDLAQETFIRVYKYRDRYQPTAKFTSFLYTVARHAWLDLLRQSRKREELTRRLEADGPRSSDGGHPAARLKMDADAALRRLPEKLRSVIVLSFYQGLKYDEIAGILRIPLGTVKSRVFLALNRLKEVWHGDPH